ncbi:MAG: serine/threonine-protein kinase [Planctomycetota bacterium]
MSQTTDLARYARIKALFGLAQPLGGSERERVLAERCQGDAALQAEVEDLLRHSDLADESFLAGDPRAGLEAPLPTRVEIPGYRIHALVDGGGSGVVFRASQLEPRREVAIKVLRLDTLGSGQVARFRREAQLLAQFSHPGIAQVLAAGMQDTDAGPLPWIAMEFVRGRHLNEHVASTGADPRGIVELFIALCDAVEHAHARGVVHRDLKPSNVLVEPSGRPKVLDFGIARTTVDEHEPGLRTRTGLLLGTLAYMAPEQARGDRAAVGPSGDVYALGVMLYEALTGALPLDLEAMDLLEAVRHVCEARPARPRTLKPGLSADLETIVLKALDKDPQRRYASAGALGADLANWRSGRPIVARRAGVWYRMARFVQRNRLLTVGVLVVVSALSFGLALATRGLRIEREARVRTSAALNELAAKIFDLAPQLGFGEEQRAGLADVERRIEQQLAVDPENRDLRAVRARALTELMTLDVVRGEYAQAEVFGQAARSLLESLLAAQPGDVALSTALSRIYAKLGEARSGLGDREGSEGWYKRALDFDEQLVREHPEDRELIEDLGWSLNRVAQCASEARDLEEFRRLAQRRIVDARRIYAEEPDNWKYIFNLSHAVAQASKAHRWFGDLAAAQRDAEESVMLAARLVELQRNRRDFLQWHVETCANTGQVILAQGDRPAALRYALLRVGSAFDLFYGDPLRELHASLLCSAAREVHLLATELGDSDSLLRLQNQVQHALALAQLAHASPASLDYLEAAARLFTPR